MREGELRKKPANHLRIEICSWDDGYSVTRAYHPSLGHGSHLIDLFLLDPEKRAVGSLKFHFRDTRERPELFPRYNAYEPQISSRFRGLLLAIGVDEGVHSVDFGDAVPIPATLASQWEIFVLLGSIPPFLLPEDQWKEWVVESES